MAIFQEILEGLKRTTSGKPFNNAAALARACGVESNLITRWMSGQRVPRLDRLGPVLDTIGVQITFPDVPPSRLLSTSSQLFDVKLAETLAAAADLFTDNLEELAHRVYGSRDDLGRLELLLSGTQRITAEECFKICEALGVDPGKAMERACKLSRMDTNKDTSKDQNVA